jgi:2-keto-3-deoxy-L-rhamnonate aldolase RhmA
MTPTAGSRKTIEERKPLIGILQTLNSTEVTEILKAAGFDWLFIDLEHSTLDVQSAQRILQAAGPDFPCMVRAPSHDEVWIKKILDTGPAGIIIPQVKSAEEARRIVQFCKYPPDGCRSVGLSRAHGYGMSFADYVANANKNIAVIMQIEHIEGVKNIEAIVTVPGIDALFVGPYDLSGSMGKIGQVKDPGVQQQIDRVRQVCGDAGMATGIFTANPEDVKTFIHHGFTIIAAGIDVMIVAQAMKQVLETAKN